MTSRDVCNALAGAPPPVPGSHLPVNGSDLEKVRVGRRKASSWPAARRFGSACMGPGCERLRGRTQRPQLVAHSGSGACGSGVISARSFKVSLSVGCC